MGDSFPFEIIFLTRRTYRFISGKNYGGVIYLKILSKLYKEYNDLIDKYNMIFSGNPISFEQIITEAIENAIQKADWSKLKHFNYRGNGKKEGYYWKPLRYKFSDKHKKASNAYIRGDIEPDDIVNFALLLGKLLQLKLKKQIIDHSWSEERLMELLTLLKITEDTEDCQYRIIKGAGALCTACPDCGQHYDGEWSKIKKYTAAWQFYPIPRFSCVACREEGDIWDVLAAKCICLPDSVEYVWNMVENESKICPINEELIAERKRKAEKERQKTIEKGKKETREIMQDCVQDYKYLYQLGFKKADLLEDVLYRGKQQSKRYDSNLWKNRIVYILRDESGQIIGLKGRYAVDSEQEWKNYVESDEFLKTQAKDRNKIWIKTINTQGVSVSENLFLLYKYVKNPKQYRYVVLVEGEKDALRVWSQHIPDVACVATFGCHLSEQQVELLKKTFGTKARVVLAFDNDNTGFTANIKAWKELKESGFTNIVFAVYPKQWKDFGDMHCNNESETYKHVTQTLCNTYSPAMYVKEMQKRGFTLPEKELAYELAEYVEEDITQEQKKKQEKLLAFFNGHIPEVKIGELPF
jgi:DNA primase